MQDSTLPLLFEMVQSNLLNQPSQHSSPPGHHFNGMNADVLKPMSGDLTL